MSINSLNGERLYDPWATVEAPLQYWAEEDRERSERSFACMLAPFMHALEEPNYRFLISSRIHSEEVLRDVCRTMGPAYIEADRRIKLLYSARRSESGVPNGAYLHIGAGTREEAEFYHTQFAMRLNEKLHISGANFRLLIPS